VTKGYQMSQKSEVKSRKVDFNTFSQPL